MFLITDIGNTNIKFVLCDKTKVKSLWRLDTSTKRTIDEYHIALDYFIKKYTSGPLKFKDIVISSVVPSLNSIIIELFRQYFQLTAILIEEKSIKNLNINITFSNKIVGVDRLADIVAAHNIYPNKNLLVIDMGTVTTFNLLDSHNNYYGQIIAPGINSFASSIRSSTSLLPKTYPHEVKNIVANSTLSAIESGVFWGYKAMVKGLIELINLEEGKKFYVIATGGTSRFFQNDNMKINMIDRDLTIKGLMLIYQKHL